MIKSNLKVNWNSLKEIRGKEGYLEFSTNLNTKIENKKYSIFSKYNILAQRKTDENWEFEIVKFISVSPNYLNVMSIYDPLDFTGTAYHYNLNGRVKKIITYNEGEKINIIKGSHLYNNETKTAHPPDTTCSHCVYLRIETWEDRYVIGGSNRKIFDITYVGSILKSTRYELVHSPIHINSGEGTFHEHYRYGGRGGNSSGSESAHPYELLLAPEELAEKLEDKIINELEGKEECINALLDKNGDSYVKDLLSNFKGDSEFDIKIESVNEIIRNDDSFSGITIYQEGSNTIKIQISSSSANTRPVLDVARTILHEYIHADMYRKLNTHYPTNNAEYLNFRETYEKYEDQIFSADSQHETMAELYIDEMTSALRSFHKNALPQDYNYMTNNGQNSLPNNFYEGLAWRGLNDQGVEAYKDLSVEKKASLENSVTLYYSATTKNCPNN